MLVHVDCTRTLPLLLSSTILLYYYILWCAAIARWEFVFATRLEPTKNPKNNIFLEYNNLRQMHYIPWPQNSARGVANINWQSRDQRVRKTILAYRVRFEDDDRLQLEYFWFPDIIMVEYPNDILKLIGALLVSPHQYNKYFRASDTPRTHDLSLFRGPSLPPPPTKTRNCPQNVKLIAARSQPQRQ